MQARKIDIDYPEVIHQSRYDYDDEKQLQKYLGKDVIIYDEHHGLAVRMRKATVASIAAFMDEYSVIIVL